MKKSDFDVYKTTNGEASVYKGIPIQLLSEFRSLFGSAYSIRYRGPRMATIGQDGRWPSQCQRDCLKKRAEYFSAYVNSEYGPNKIKRLQSYVDYYRELVEKQRNEINHLERANDNLTGEVQGLSIQINSLEATVAELEEEAGEMYSRFNDLQQVIEDINYMTSGY